MTSLRILMALFCLTLAACTSQEKKDEKAAQVWSGKMQGLAGNVKDLVPYAYNKRNYADPAHQQKVKATLVDFSKNMHALKPEMGKKYLGADPLVKYSLEQMRGDVDRAIDAFNAGQVEYSRSVVKSVVNHCFRCHSLTDQGARAPWDVSAFKDLTLTPIEKADLLVAARDYEGARSHLEAQLNSSEFAQNYPFEYEGALRRYLAIMLRINKDPSSVLRELDKISQKNDVPYYVQEQMVGWKKSLSDWSKESKKKPKGSLLDQAKQRIKKGQNMQSYMKDHSGDVEFVRATGLLHEFLSGGQKIADEALAEAYYLLGESYEVIDEMGYWNLHEVYYESCIRAAPKSKVAKSCFQRLESSVYVGYSGSSGVHVPQHEKQRLQQLKSLMN